MINISKVLDLILPSAVSHVLGHLLLVLTGLMQIVGGLLNLGSEKHACQGCQIEFKMWIIGERCLKLQKVFNFMTGHDDAKVMCIATFCNGGVR